MKLKKALPVFALLLAASLFGGCSSAESNGVPDSVLRNCEEYQNFADNYDSVEYDVLHDMDTESHIDHVSLTLYGKNQYINASSIIRYHFQYYKSDDLWTMIDVSRPINSAKLNADAFIEDSPWSGKRKNTDSIGAFNNEYTYEIYIDGITEDSILLRYYIQYTNDRYDDVIQDTTIELPLQYNGSHYYVDIDVSHLYTTFESYLRLYLSRNGLWSQEFVN